MKTRILSTLLATISLSTLAATAGATEFNHFVPVAGPVGGEGGGGGLGSLSGPCPAGQLAVQWGDTAMRYCDPMTITSSDPLWPATNAIDGNLDTAYSSQGFASATNDRNSYLWISMQSPVFVKAIELHARMYDGVPNGFPGGAVIWVETTTPEGVTWVNEGTWYFAPDANGLAVVPISAVEVQGVWIQPVTLGTDIYGGHYFQMAEVTFD